ncbi:hypothetical protein Golob_001987, partial [Gossypium lobatum]|nr:hypothetical protein [Gossypium lobatum]
GGKTSKPKVTRICDNDKLANSNSKAVNVIFNGVDLESSNVTARFWVKTEQ